jgi:DnaJ homolog subfamily C member 19
MMIALLLAAALGWWLHKRGELVPNLQRLAVGGAFLFGTIRLLETGRLLPAALAAAGGALWWTFGQRPSRAVVPQSDMISARALLGVSVDDGPDAIRAAHRKLIAEVHPDRGGSADLAARVTAARDLLLAAVANSRGAL